MGYKDTVMSPEELVPYLSTTDLYSAMCVDYKKAFEAQAEISFKAGEKLSLEKQGQAYLEGKQAGQRALLEWSAGDCDCGQNHISDRWHCSACRLAKLKEWGLE